ncbi:hypothetical protein Tco_0709001 [Tanacetum coccineum]
MPPRMRTRSTGRPVADPWRGNGVKRVGRGRGVEDLGENLLPAILAQVCNQGNVGSQMGNVVNEKIPENVRNILVNSNQEGCSYKEFLAYNPKEYDGKGGVVFKMIEEFRPSHEMQKLETKLWNHIMVRAGHAAYTDRFHELARLVPHLVTLKCRKIERYMYGLAPQIRRMVAAMELKTMQKEERIRVLSPSVPPATPTKHPEGLVAHDSTEPPPLLWEHAMNVGSTDHLKPACPRLNRAQGPGGNHPNQVVANNGGQGRGNQGNQARGIEPSELGFRYEIEVSCLVLVEIDKVIKSMDWLSNHKAEIIYHEKVVRIPLLDGKVLRVLVERLEEKARLLMRAKTRDKKQE